jgi:prephenate dehydratase
MDLLDNHGLRKLQLDVFTVLSERIPVGVIPHENSIFGTVTETYDLLRDTSRFVCGEVTRKIEHCLLVQKGVQIHQIKRIFSHEQVRYSRFKRILASCKDRL